MHAVTCTHSTAKTPTEGSNEVTTHTPTHTYRRVYKNRTAKYKRTTHIQTQKEHAHASQTHTLHKCTAIHTLYKACREPIPSKYNTHMKLSFLLYLTEYSM